MLGEDRAPKTINRRVSSVSSFYRYLAGVASEARLPITVPNPAHAQFIARMTSDPVNATKALSATRARQLMGLPTGETPTAFDQHNSQLRKLLKYAFADKTHDLRHGRLGKYSVVLHLNVQTSILGEVRVEMLDAEGRTVPGFSRRDCDPMVTNAVDRVVTWRGDADVSSFQGEAVRLRFLMRNAKLYAFQFKES